MGQELSTSDRTEECRDLKGQSVPLSSGCGEKHSCCLGRLLARRKPPAVGILTICASSLLKEQGRPLIKRDEEGVSFKEEGDCSLSASDGKEWILPHFSNPEWPFPIQHPSSQRLLAGMSPEAAWRLGLRLGRVGGSLGKVRGGGTGFSWRGVEPWVGVWVWWGEGGGVATPV